jgi:hypothetical protein
MVVKKNIDPGRPVNRPMAPVSDHSGWGKTLGKAELLGIIDRIYKQQEEQKMSKLSDSLTISIKK